MPKKTKRVECGAKSGPGQFYQPRTCVLDKGHGSSEHVDGRGLMWRDLQMGPKVPEWIPRRIKVKAVANGHIDLRSPGPTIDGVEMNWGDLFLAPRQHDSAANGVYIWVHRNTPVSPVDNPPAMGDEVEAAFGTCNAESRLVRANDNVFVRISETWPTSPPQCPAVTYRGGSVQPRCILPAGHQGPHVDRIDGSGWIWTTDGSYIRPPIETPCGEHHPYPHILGRCVLPAGHAGTHGTKVDSDGRAVGDTWPPLHSRPPGPRRIAMAWHDTICPEGKDCRDRFLHSIGENLVTTGLLEKFLARMAEMS